MRKRSAISKARPLGEGRGAAVVPRIFRWRITRPTRPLMWWPASASRDRREYLSLRSGVRCVWRYVSASWHRVGQRTPRSTRETAVEDTYLPRPTLKSGEENAVFMTHGAVSMQGNITKSRSQLRLGTATSWLRLIPRLEHRSKDRRFSTISFYIRATLDAPLACVVASRGLTQPERVLAAPKHCTGQLSGSD
jgi:hypothetical protein